MKKAGVLLALVALVACMALLAGCEKKVPQGAIAAVGDGVVTKEQFDEILAQAKAQYDSQRGVKFPKEGTPQYNQLVASIVTYLVQNEVVAQQAEDMDISVSQKELDERIKAIEEQVGGAKKLDKVLKEQGVGREELREQLTAQMLQDKVREKVYKDVKISDAQLKQYYEDPANRAQFEQPESVDTRHILVKTKAEAEKARALLEADGSDANWKKVAKQYSEDPSSKNAGGDIGSRPKGSLVPEYEKVAYKLKPGEISKPVKSQFGWHVIEVKSKTPAKERTFEESKEQIKQMLMFQEQAKAWERWLKDAMAEAEIVYAPGFNPDQLTAPPSPSGAPQPETSPTGQ